MNEARYLQAFADATDAFLRLIGVDADYHRHRRQLLHRRDPHPPRRRGPRRRADRNRRPRSSKAPGKRLRLFHRLTSGDRLLATGEHMLIHVSLATRAASEPGPAVAAKLAEIAAAHAALPAPDGLGRAVGQPR